MTDTTVPSDSIRVAVIRILMASGAAFGLLVWILYFKRSPEDVDSSRLSFLPAVNASLNGLCALCILSGFFAIKSGRRKSHMGFMVTAIFLSAMFLVSYITYHAIHGDTKFLTEGVVRYVYFGILISHISCTVFALPLIFSAVYFAVTKRFDLHKKVVKFTIPLWLYVSVTGVTIFFLLKANS